MTHGRTLDCTTHITTASSMIYRSPALTNFSKEMLNAVTVLVEPDAVWEVKIDEHPMSQTVVFESTLDWKNWKPVKGQRLSGPGPRLGTIVTNAVAGGPAHFRGRLSGSVGFRVRCTRYDDTPIRLRIETGKQMLPVTLIGTEPVTFIIEEEKSLQDLLSDELGVVNP